MLRVARAVLLAAVTSLFAASSCATAPRPVVLDGADRVPVNDPATIEKLKRLAAGASEAPTHTSSDIVDGRR